MPKDAPMDKKIKHLEMIQNIITRMAQNSFMIKGWTITLVAAMFAFVPKTVTVFIPIALAPILMFMFLDSYFLQLERRYRSYYDLVCSKDEEDIDFSLKICKECKTAENSFWKCLFSKSILFFYDFILLVAIGVIVAMFV